MTTCPVCGAVNPQGATYCENCGVELPAANEAAAPVSAQAELADHNAPSGDWTTVTVVPNMEGQIVSASNQTVQNVAQDVPSQTVSPAATGEPVMGEPISDPTATPTPAAQQPASSAPVNAVPTPSAPQARLGVKRFGAATGDVIPLGGQRLVVGRFDASTGPVDVDLTGLQGVEHISRRHAELYTEGGGWYVRDLGSTNGVYVRRAGEDHFSPRLQAPARLQNGDELAFGNLTMTFHED